MQKWYKDRIFIASQGLEFAILHKNSPVWIYQNKETIVDKEEKLKQYCKLALEAGVSKELILSIITNGKKEALKSFKRGTKVHRKTTKLGGF